MHFFQVHNTTQISKLLDWLSKSNIDLDCTDSTELYKKTLMSIAFLRTAQIPHHHKQNLDIIFKLPGDINAAFANMINHKIYDINRSQCLISQTTLKYINNTKRIKPDLLLEYGAINGLEDVVKWALELGADPSAKAHDRNLNILEVALYANCALTIIDTLLQAPTITPPNIVPYIMAIKYNLILIQLQKLLKDSQIYIKKKVFVNK